MSDASTANDQPEAVPPPNDTPGGWRGLPRLLKMVIIAVVSVVVMLALVKVIVELRDRADPVDTAAIVKQFEEDGGADGDDDALIASGVFVYDAVGTEFVDLLGGPLHEFPPEVVATTTGNDCGGSTVELKLFEQRDDELVLCPTDDGALSLRSFITRHEFVGVKDETITTCPEGAVWPAGLFDVRAATTVTVECTAEGDMVGTAPAVLTSRVMGHDQVEVGGEKVDAQQLRISTVVGTKGTSTYGTYDNDFWVTDDGVVVQRSLDADVTAKTVAGQVGFKETYDLTLQKLPG